MAAPADRPVFSIRFQPSSISDSTCPSRWAAAPACRDTYTGRFFAHFSIDMEGFSSSSAGHLTTLTHGTITLATRISVFHANGVNGVWIGGTTYPWNVEQTWSCENFKNKWKSLTVVWKVYVYHGARRPILPTNFSFRLSSHFDSTLPGGTYFHFTFIQIWTATTTKHTATTTVVHEVWCG